MRSDKLIPLIENVKRAVRELENEIKADPGAYLMSDEHYADVVWYNEWKDDPDI